MAADWPNPHATSSVTVPRRIWSECGSDSPKIPSDSLGIPSAAAGIRERDRGDEATRWRNVGIWKENLESEIETIYWRQLPGHQIWRCGVSWMLSEPQPLQLISDSTFITALSILLVPCKWGCWNVMSQTMGECIGSQGSIQLQNNWVASYWRDQSIVWLAMCVLLSCLLLVLSFVTKLIRQEKALDLNPNLKCN